MTLLAVPARPPGHDTIAARRTQVKRGTPRCSLLVSKSDWWGYLVLEGRAQLMSPENTGTEELRLALREVYQAAAGKEHSNWEEYDEAMLRDRRSAVIIVPEHICGPTVQG